MSLENVFARIEFAQSARDRAGFEDAVNAIITNAYNNSSVARAMFERLATSDRNLVIEYEFDEAATRIDLKTVFVDPDRVNYKLGLDGTFHLNTFTRFFLHECSHAIDRTFDPIRPNWTQVRQDAFIESASADFFGATVSAENLIMDELGESFTRGSYFVSNDSLSYRGVTSFTGGEKVDLAVMLGQMHNSVTSSPDNLSMVGRPSSRDLLIGTELANELDGATSRDFLWGFGGDDTLTGGAGHDLLYGGKNDDTLNGGAGNDELFGGAHNDTLNGGDGLLGDEMTGGSGDDTYYVNNILDEVIETSSLGLDTVVISPNLGFAFSTYALDNVEVVVVQSEGAKTVWISGNDVDSITFDDQGGTIGYELDAAAVQHQVSVIFSSAKDTFVFEENGFVSATGVVRDGTPIGFFWGFELSGILSNDRIDITDLGVDVLLTADSSTSTYAGQYLMAPGTELTITSDDRYFTNNSSAWYVLDLETGLFSPSFSGNINSNMFII